MPNLYYEGYLKAVGDAAYIDLSWRCDPARTDQPWNALTDVVDTYGAPWIVQIWTKSPRGVLIRGRSVIERLQKLGTTVTCQLTVTGLGPEWEPCVPWPIDWQAIEELIQVLKTPDAIAWRYDPIIPGVSNAQTFELICQGMQQRKITRGIFNIIDLTQPKTKERLGNLMNQIEPNPDLSKILSEFVQIGLKYQIRFGTCAELRKLVPDVEMDHRGCGDFNWFVKVSGRRPQKRKRGSSRTGCKCIANFDLGQYGQYDTCHGCKYCYAR